IVVFAKLKKAASVANNSLGKLSDNKKEAISYACDRVINRELDAHFPLVVWQTGSGTQSNMNVNEVVSYVANEYLEGKGIEETVHPNADVIMSQSSNDTYPMAMHVPLLVSVEEQLLPGLMKLKNTFEAQEEEFKSIIKIGRTHLQYATPLTLGQEISGWRYMLEKCEELIEESKRQLGNLAIGGTAVEPRINAHTDFGLRVANELSIQKVYKFDSSSNIFHALNAHDEVVYLHGALKALA